MKSNNIIFTKANCAELMEEIIPELRENEVLVRMEVSSISSGTERANLTGSLSVNSTIPMEKEAKFPRRGGYSSAGVVEQVGESVTKVKPGDRVAMTWSCHNQYMVISQDRVYPIGDISFEDAALMNIASFPLAAIRKCKLEIGESAIVMGMGILGVFALKLLKQAGAAPIIAVDPDAGKREKALQCGADAALDPFAPDFAQQAKALTEGGAKVGIEVTGNGGGLNGILDCMARFGRVALLGCTRNSDFNVDYYRKVHGPGITLIGAHTDARPKQESYPGWWTQDDDINTLIRLVKFGRIKLSDVIDETYSPAEATEVYRRLAEEKTFPLTQFDWRRLL